MIEDVIKRFNECCNKTPCNICEMENDNREEYICYHQGFYMKGYEQGRADERAKILSKGREFMADKNEKCKCFDCFERWLKRGVRE